MGLKTRSRIALDEGPLAAPASPPPVASPAPLAVQQRRERRSQVPASRQGLVPFGFFVPPEARRQIKGWAGMNGRTTQDIGQEMMDDWFAKQGLHRLAGHGDKAD